MGDVGEPGIESRGADSAKFAQDVETAESKLRKMARRTGAEPIPDGSDNPLDNTPGQQFEDDVAKAEIKLRQLQQQPNPTESAKQFSEGQSVTDGGETGREPASETTAELNEQIDRFAQEQAEQMAAKMAKFMKDGIVAALEGTRPPESNLKKQEPITEKDQPEANQPSKAHTDALLHDEFPPDATA